LLIFGTSLYGNDVPPLAGHSSPLHEFRRPTCPNEGLSRDAFGRLAKRGWYMGVPIPDPPGHLAPARLKVLP